MNPFKLTDEEVRSEVGAFLGLGRGEKCGDFPWTECQLRIIDTVISDGKRKFAELGNIIDQNR